MFGRLARGTDAEAGSLLLSYAVADNPTELFLIIPHIAEQQKLAIVVPQSGQAHLYGEEWLDDNFWDVTEAATFDVEPEKFSIDSLPPNPGDIAFAGACEWMIGALVGQRFAKAEWLPVKNNGRSANGAARIRFPTWRLVVEHRSIRHTLFARKAPAR